MFVCRKIVSESRVMMNGLDTNGVNQQCKDLNDFTDGQPFGPVPQIDWSSGHATAVLPTDNVSADNTNNRSNYVTEKNSDSDGKNNETVANENESTGSKAKTNVTYDQSGNKNNSSLIDQNLVVSDSVKLPPSSSLFSYIKSSETASESGSDIKEQDSVSSEGADLVKESNNDKAADNISADVSNEETKKIKSEISQEQVEEGKSDTDMSEDLPVFEDSKETEEKAAQKSSSKVEQEDEPPEKKVETLLCTVSLVIKNFYHKK